jgi:oligopeptide/dipeptide ABC transporter ATP-binding protein
MYLGQIVEIAEKRRLFAQPRHPYTEALLDSVPVPDPSRRQDRAVLTGEVPSPMNPPRGCRFHTRCPLVEPRCREIAPPLVDVGGGHRVACHVRASAAGREADAATADLSVGRDR